MSVKLPVTRSLSNDNADNYSSGIERYKLGDYKQASIDFSNAVMDNNSASGPRFFLGITKLATGSYDQAINLLSEVSNHSGDFSIEAEWYLGLAYLKTGEKEKASACFGILSRTPGFYHDRAEKILRHLR
jgi:tetratricopeptide (TPR) repeat protein